MNFTNPLGPLASSPDPIGALQGVVRDPRTAILEVVLRTKLGDVSVDPSSGQKQGGSAEGGGAPSGLGRAALVFLEPRLIIRTIAGDVEVDLTPS